MTTAPNECPQCEAWLQLLRALEVERRRLTPPPPRPVGNGEQTRKDG